MTKCEYDIFVYSSNDDFVLSKCENIVMDDWDVRAEFTALRKRTGLNQAEFAKLLGYSGSSGAQNYEYPNGIYTQAHLPTSLIKRMLKTLVGKGNPKIKEADIHRLSALQGGPQAQKGGEPGTAMDSDKFLEIVLLGDRAIIQKNLHPLLNEIQRGEIYHALIRTYYDEGDVDLRTALGIINALHSDHIGGDNKEKAELNK